MNTVKMMAALRVGLAGGAVLFLLGTRGVMPAAAAPEVAMQPGVRALLRDLLDDGRWQALQETLLAGDQPWGTLGPAPDGRPEPLPLSAPEKTLRLEIPADARGSGKPWDPYVNVIGEFLARFEFAPHDIPATPRTHRNPRRGDRPMLDPEAQQRAVEQYLATLDYAPVTVIVPAGHYRETAIDRPDNVALVVPPGVWLRGEGTVVIEPEVQRGDDEVLEVRPVDFYPVRQVVSSVLVRLNPASGLVNLTLDGSRSDDFVPWPVAPYEGPMPATRVTAVEAAHQSVIADCHLRRFTHGGIIGGRDSWGTIVVNNVIERIGHSGISTGAQWLVRDNRIRLAGIYRTGRHNDGDDGIIIRNSELSTIANNLVVQKRAPGSRHLFSGQCMDFNLYAGNIGIVEGESRKIFGFSDGSNHNRIIYNVSLSTGGVYESRDPLVKNFTGFLINGQGNRMQHNFTIGAPWAYCAIGRHGAPPNLVTGNYGEYIISPFHHRYSRNYVLEDNVFRFGGRWHGYQHFESPLPRVAPIALDDDRYGLFVPAEKSGRRAAR